MNLNKAVCKRCGKKANKNLKVKYGVCSLCREAQVAFSDPWLRKNLEKSEKEIRQGKGRRYNDTIAVLQLRQALKGKSYPLHKVLKELGLDKVLPKKLEKKCARCYQKFLPEGLCGGCTLQLSMSILRSLTILHAFYGVGGADWKVFEQWADFETFASRLGTLEALFSSEEKPPSILAGPSRRKNRGKNKKK